MSKFCTTFIPVLGTCVSSVRTWHNTRGAGMPLSKYPGCGFWKGYEYNIRVPTRDFCEFCENSIPVPGTSVTSVRLPCPVPGIRKPYSTQPCGYLASSPSLASSRDIRGHGSCSGPGKADRVGRIIQSERSTGSLFLL